MRVGVEGGANGLKTGVLKLLTAEGPYASLLSLLKDARPCLQAVSP